MALLLEGWALARPSVPVPGPAAYALVAGGLTVVVRLAAERLVPGRAARLSAVSVALLFLWLNFLYVVNVAALPGEPFDSAKSLSYDVALAVGYVLVIALLARSRGIEQLRERGRGLWSMLGAAILFVSAAVIGTHWPSAPSVPQRSGSGPNLLLIVLDSARRDRMQFHGYGRPTTVALEPWLAQSRVYEQGFAASSWTVPTVDWILREVPRSDGRPETLAQRLAARGYVTACFSDNPHLTDNSPLLEGFDVVERSVGEWRALLRHTLLGEFVERIDGGDDRRLVDRIIRWRAEHASRVPSFVYVHLMDSHTPYHHGSIDGVRRAGRQIQFPVSGMTMTVEEAADIVARYDGGVRSATEQAARLLRDVKGGGRPFLVVVTADHGESLGEEGRWFHGGSLAPELLAVPLLVVGDRVEPGRVSDPIGQASVARTFLSAASGDCVGCAGRDLRDSHGGNDVQGWLQPTQRYRIADGFKLVLDSGSGTAQLFDVRRDPGERVDLASSQPERVREMRRDLGLAPVRLSVPVENLERLRSLGYVGGEAGQAERSNR